MGQLALGFLRYGQLLNPSSSERESPLTKMWSGWESRAYFYGSIFL